MENVMRKKNFQLFIKILHMLTRLLFIVCSLGLILLVGALLVIGVTPSEKIIDLLQKGEMQASLNFAGIHLSLSESAIANFHFTKQPMLMLLGLMAIYIVLCLCIIYCVQSMLKALRQNEVFTLQNSKYIEWTAYCIVVMSFILQPIQTLVFISFEELFQLSSFINNSEWIQSISYEYINIHWSLLFSGVIIWIIGRTFKYGAFLQEEFDATI